jgi:hypothetical protein
LNTAGVSIRRRTLPVRLRNAYRVYRSLSMSRWESMRFAWRVATVQPNAWRPEIGE